MISPVDIGRGFQETSDRFFWIVGFLTTVAVCGGFLRLRFFKNWTRLQRNLTRARWRRNFR